MLFAKDGSEIKMMLRCCMISDFLPLLLTSKIQIMQTYEHLNANRLGDYYLAYEGVLLINMGLTRLIS